MPYQAPSLIYDKGKTFYTPQTDKLIGYTQCPAPRCAPYFNQKQEIKYNTKKKEFIKKLEETYESKNPLNSSIFSYKQMSIIGPSFLTGTIYDSQKAKSLGKIPVYAERQILDDLSFYFVEKSLIKNRCKGERGAFTDLKNNKFKINTFSKH